MKNSLAIVTIKRAAEMDKRERNRIAAWLRVQADFLEEHGEEMAKRFTARYLAIGENDAHGD